MNDATTTDTQSSGLCITPERNGSGAEPLIRVSNLTIGWGSHIIQQNTSFEVERGDIFVILGRSGCGKSTLLRHLIGLAEPLRGEIMVDGIDPQQLARQRPRFGVMFQGGALLGSYTVGENVALPLMEWTRLPEDAIAAIARSKLRLVGLDGSENKMPSELSGGMRKRAAIARAMALEPQLIFLDEPSAGLDPVTAAELDELILSLNAGLNLTVVLVTHELESIFKIGKRCIMLDKDEKRVIAAGNPHELRDSCPDPRVRAFFNRDPELAS
jgi:phospholipid/cholesterol/gamma-HCH transport system ATP-binding protein